MPEHKSFLKMTNNDGPYVPNPKSLDGVPDLCMLTHLGELNILHNLKCRYEKRQIYTSTTAKVLVALNPYEPKPEDYTEAVMKSYQEQATNLEGLADKNSLPPHLFWVSNSAYSNLVATKTNQSIIVCGESGAGKTESAKYMMRFLAYTTTSTSVDAADFAEAEKIGQQVLDANPILESFGNAKTLINNNSSRFGKFTKMLFTDGKKKGALKLVGAGIDSYLLEKSRVVYQDKGERNYHIFYQLTHCHDQHPELKLGPTSKFSFTSKSGCDTLEDLRYPGAGADINWHKELEEAWETLKISREDSMNAYKIVAGILKLGNITFKDKTGEGSDIEQPELIKDVSDLWAVDIKALTKRIETRTLYLPGGKTLIKPLNKGDAEFNRDSMCRNIYNGLFRWVVWRINQVSFPGDSAPDTYIGILDVFGFEIFANNSFEQFCINFANERLQQYFNYHVLQAEQDLYQREALLWNPIDLPNNQDTIDLFTNKPYGIYAILDSTCVQPKGNDTIFTQNLFKRFKYHPKLRKVEQQEGSGKQKQKINGFTIKHYAGAVLYNCEEFLVKNSDASEFDTTAMMYASSNSVSKVVLQMKPNGTMDTSAPKRGHKRAFLSTGSVFADQLASLMKELQKTSPYFVRCVKPNPKKKPRHFVGEFVRPQLRCGGLIEALRIIKLGFPTRCKYTRVHELFGSILRRKPIKNLNMRDFTQAVMTVVGDKSSKPSPDEYQMGLSAIFFRPGKQTWLTAVLDKTPDQISEEQVAEIRKYITKKRWVRAAGLVKGWMRTETFLQATRFSKAATIMVVIYRTFGSLLKSARGKLTGINEEEEARRRQQDEEFQAALRAKKQLEEMKKLKEQQDAEIASARARAEKSVQDKQADLETSQRKGEELRQQYAAFQEKAAGEKKKYADQAAKQAEEIAAAESKIAAAQEEAKAAKAAQEEKQKTITNIEKDLAAVREQKAELEKNLGDGKEAYEAKLGDRDSSIKRLQDDLARLEAEKGQGKEHYEKEISDREAKIEAEQAKAAKLDAEIAETKRKAENDKAEQDRQIANRDQEIKELKERLAALQKQLKELNEKTESELAKLKSDLETSQSTRAKEAEKNQAALAAKEEQTKKQEAEIQEFRNVVVKESEAKMAEIQKELDAGRAEVRAAKKAAQDEADAARQAVRDKVEGMEDELHRVSEEVSVLKLDMQEYKRENVVLEEQWEEKLGKMKKSVALEHKRQHQSEFNDATEKSSRKVRDLKDELKSLKQQLEVAKKWVTKAGKGRR